MVTLRPVGRKVIQRGFFRDSDLDFQARGALGRAVRGSSEVGEVLATIARIRNQGGWAREWAVTARRVQGEADRARDAGHLVSASSGYLRAATYWASVVDGLSTGSKLRPAARRVPDPPPVLGLLHRLFRGCAPAGVGAVRVDDVAGLPAPTGRLRAGAPHHGRDQRQRRRGQRPLDVSGRRRAGPGLERLRHDGPGQQSMLFERETHFRRDWEAVLTPVIGLLAAREDVDAHRMTGYGISQAGYWLPRALAFEHRLLAAVIDPGVVDVSTSWLGRLSKGMRESLDGGDRDKFNRDMGLATKIPSLGRTLAFRGRPYEHADWFDLFTAVRTYRLDPGTAALIRTPLLITDPDGEQFWPGQSSQLSGLVPGRVDVLHFGADEGAAYHCQPTGRPLTENRMFDWLGEFVPARA
jgi:hypothetical protein